MGNVMGGIAEALVATAIGILVALPAVIFYNVFQKKGADIEENANALGNLVLASMKASSGTGSPAGAQQTTAGSGEAGQEDTVREARRAPAAQTVEA